MAVASVCRETPAMSNCTSVIRPPSSTVRPSKLASARRPPVIIMPAFALMRSNLLRIGGGTVWPLEPLAPLMLPVETLPKFKPLTFTPLVAWMSAGLAVVCTEPVGVTSRTR